MDSVSQFLRSMMDSPLRRDAESKVRKCLEFLVERGKVPAEEAKDLLKELSQASETGKNQLDEWIGCRVKEGLTGLSLPSRTEIKTLRERIYRLSERMERLESLLARRNGEKED